MIRCSSILFLLFPVIAFAQPVDSAIAAANGMAEPEAKITACINVADLYMEQDYYDSAQTWLSKAYTLLDAKPNSIAGYFLRSRQAEVYYYNNLQQLGLQESRRGLAVAQALNDSLLLADSYNFLGLFYMNMDSLATSIPYFKKGLSYAKQPPYPSGYLSLSKPHHLYGNLGEAYFKLNKTDSALLFFQRSFEKASAIQWDRGIAVAMKGMGDVYFKHNNTDSALSYFTKANALAANAGDIDVSLACFAAEATLFQQDGKLTGASKALEKGFEILAQYPHLNRFYALIFFDAAESVYRKQNNQTGLIKTLEMKSATEAEGLATNNKQIQTILNAGMENEKRLSSLQVQDAQRKQALANTRLLAALAALAILLIGFLVYRYYQNQRHAVSRIRNKISQDLHDDIGASISSLHIYGTVAEQSLYSNPQKTSEMLGKINRQSRDILETMGDIVWSMKDSSSGTSFETKIKNFAAELLNDQQIAFEYKIESGIDAGIRNIEGRKNILLIIKEAINNIAKYSEASAASVNMFLAGTMLQLTIRDNGKGFDEASVKAGNGLNNMRSRAKELNGHFKIESSPGNGTRIFIQLPWQNLKRT